MPELPEVETIRLGLQKKIIGLKIKHIDVLTPRTVQVQIRKPFDYAQGLQDKKVLKVWRLSKVLGVDLSGNLTLLFHLKMTGQLIWVGDRVQGAGSRLVGGHPTTDMRDQMPGNHTRVIFTFSDGSKLFFNDQRKFGWIKIVDSEQVAGDSSIKTLGPEPLEKRFTWQVLRENLLKRKNMPVKMALMDQKVVSGVGNIYSSEACFDAKIDPRTKVKDLTDGQFKSLHRGVIKSLRDGIKYGGATRAHFVDPEGHKGYFLDYAFVYGRDKHPCKKCGAIIKKVQLGGRGTYFCELCQK